MIYGGFPKLGVPFWGVPILRLIVVWGLKARNPCDRLLLGRGSALSPTPRSI